MTREEFIAKLHKQAAAVYLACDHSIAKDLSESLSHAANLLAVAIPSAEREHVDSQRFTAGESKSPANTVNHLESAPNAERASVIEECIQAIEMIRPMYLKKDQAREFAAVLECEKSVRSLISHAATRSHVDAPTNAAATSKPEVSDSMVDAFLLTYLSSAERTKVKTDDDLEALVKRALEAALSVPSHVDAPTNAAATPEHVCGLQGYNPMIDAPCPGCVARSASSHAVTPTEKP